MKKLFLLAVLVVTSVFMYSFVAKDSYVIKGVTDVKQGVVVLNTPFKSDTVQIKNGLFEFRGTVSRPTSALMLIQPSAGQAVPVILEPGEIKVTFKKGVYNIEGSAENIRLQNMQNQLRPFRTKVEELRNKSFALKGEDQKSVLAEIVVLNADKAKKTIELLKADTGLAGLVVLSSIYRSQAAGILLHYLEVFKPFEYDPNYKHIAEFYRGMPKGDAGLIAPAFTLPDPQGNMVSLSANKGKYVLIDFWFHDCVFCRRMSPHLVKIYADMKKEDFEIVSISVDPKEKEKDWRKAMKEDGTTWTQLWDYDKTLPGVYGVDGYPTMFLLDKQGKILEKIVGYHDEAFFRKTLDKYIKR